MRYFVLLILLAIVIAWLVQRAHNDKEAEEGPKKETLNEQIHQTTDYLTGKTPINAMIRSQMKIRTVSIQRAARNFEIMNGRPPNSLEELVKENLIGEDQMYMKYGNVKSKLISGLMADGRFFIHWIGMDRKKGTSDDWVEVF